MDQALPWILLVGAGVSLLAALYALWQSLRAALAPELALDDASGLLVGSDARRALLLEKEALLQNLKDLEFERDAGKVAPEDFARVERKLRGRAREVLRLLDEEVAPYRAEAEALLAAHLGGAGAAPSVAPEASASPIESAPAEAAEPAAARACGECGTKNDADAAFCKKCGTKLGDGKGEGAPQDHPVATEEST